MADPSWLALGIFGVVYLGMVLGGLPRLQLDRTGVALLGAIAVVGSGLMTVEQAAQAIHLPTILLLFGFMVVSAQMQLGGFYGAVTRAIVAWPVSPAWLMGAVIAVVAALSAVFSNDIVCLAVAPVLARACLQRGLPPLPFLLGLACAANIGSAATLIGNPQNMLIGSVLQLSFTGYMAWAWPPVLAGLLALWALLAWPLRQGRAQAAALATSGATGAPTSAPTSAAAAPLPAIHAATAAAPGPTPSLAGLSDRSDEPPLDPWQTAKGLAVAGALLLAFLFTGWPHEVVALVGAGLLLLSQRFHSSRMLALVDWELLVLFMGLFVVNAALAQSGLTAQAVAWLAAQGVRLSEPVPLFVATLLGSNLVSNVPAVMLLLPAAQAAPGGHAGPALALVSTLAGNLFLVGSIANLIVVDAARRQGIAIDWRQHAATGVPVTVLSLGLTVLWLLWRAA